MYVCNNIIKMQVIKVVRIQLTLNDLIENIQQLTKEQLIQKFRMMLDRKQIQINDKIEKLNSDHLLLLQKKVLVIEKKDDQIVKLNSTISTIKNQLSQAQTKLGQLTDDLIQTKLKNSHFQNKFNQSQSIFQEEKKKRKILNDKFQALQQTHDKKCAQFDQLQRQHKKIRQEKQLWHGQTQYLLKNQINKFQHQKQAQINHLHLHYENMVSELRQKLKEEKKKSDTKRQKISEQTKMMGGLNKKIEQLKDQIAKLMKNKGSNSEISVSIQTQECLDLNEGKAKEKVQCVDECLQVLLECDKCGQKERKIQQLEDQLQRMRLHQNKVNANRLNGMKKTQSVIVKKMIAGTQCDTAETKSSCSQTIYKYLQIEEQRKLMEDFKIIHQNGSRLLEIEKKKYEQLQRILYQRPSRKQDRQTIYQLSEKCVGLDLQILQLNTEIEGLKTVIDQDNRRIKQLQQRYNSPFHQPEDKKQQSKEFSITNPKGRHSFTLFSRKANQQHRFKTIESHSSSNAKTKNSLIHSLQLRSSQEFCQSRSGSPRCQKTPNNALKTILLQKGIVFRGKEDGKKNQMDGISSNRLRGYKKYKGNSKTSQSCRKKQQVLINVNK